MSGYILCQTKKAEVPYFVENISANIYSLEELCYYLYHNLYLIDQTIMNEGLCNWIRDELNLPRLAEKLRPVIGKFASAEDLLYPIFKEINYLSYEELKALNVQLTELDQMPVALREKRKGDSMMENAMYVNAIRVYQSLLERKDLEMAREGLTARVYHNLGCAYSYLFQMEKAVECFWKAYISAKREEDLLCYLIAFRSVYSFAEYEKRFGELSVSQSARDALQQKWVEFGKIPEKQLEPEKIDAMLEEFTRDYHRSTGS